jgi:MYXO-CTERM domain-containing protein
MGKRPSEASGPKASQKPDGDFSQQNSEQLPDGEVTQEQAKFSLSDLPSSLIEKLKAAKAAVEKAVKTLNSGWEFAKRGVEMRKMSIPSAAFGGGLAFVVAGGAVMVVVPGEARADYLFGDTTSGPILIDLDTGTPTALSSSLFPTSNGTVKSGYYDNASGDLILSFIDTTGATGDEGILIISDVTGSPSSVINNGFDDDPQKLRYNPDTGTFSFSDDGGSYTCPDPTDASLCDTHSPTASLSFPADEGGLGRAITIDSSGYDVIDLTTSIPELSGSLTLGADAAIDHDNQIGLVLDTAGMQMHIIDLAGASPSVSSTETFGFGPVNLLLYTNATTGNREVAIIGYYYDTEINIFEISGTTLTPLGSDSLSGTTVSSADILTVDNTSAATTIYATISGSGVIKSFDVSSSYAFSGTPYSGGSTASLAFIPSASGVDDDGDGFDSDVDCDDTDPNINPGETETDTCDGVDTDCSLGTDGTDPSELADLDGDGTADCSDDDGDSYSEDDGDCDDTDPNINPGETETDTCDGIDADCSLGTDGTDPDELEDLDGIGGADCDDFDGDGQNEIDGDCDDEDADYYTGAPEVACWNHPSEREDNNCDGTFPDECSDADLDGDGVTEAEGDCDDSDPDINPDADEYCDDSVDSNCDESDNDDAVDMEDRYIDNDGDNFGDQAIQACASEIGTVPTPGDCDDGDPDAYPGSTAEGDACSDKDCDTVPVCAVTEGDEPPECDNEWTEEDECENATLSEVDDGEENQILGEGTENVEINYEGLDEYDEEWIQFLVAQGYDVGQFVSERNDGPIQWVYNGGGWITGISGTKVKHRTDKTIQETVITVLDETGDHEVIITDSNDNEIIIGVGDSITMDDETGEFISSTNSDIQEEIDEINNPDTDDDDDDTADDDTEQPDDDTAADDDTGSGNGGTCGDGCSTGAEGGGKSPYLPVVGALALLGISLRRRRPSVVVADKVDPAREAISDELAQAMAGLDLFRK